MKRLTILLTFLLLTIGITAQSDYKYKIDFTDIPETPPVKVAGLDRNPEVVRSSNITSSIPSYYYEAAIKGRWDYFNPPQDMAMQAYLDQKKGIGGGFWGVAIRSMFTSKHTNLENYIPSSEAKRRIIYQNPANVKDSAYWAQQCANLGILGGIIFVLVGGLIGFVVWKTLRKIKNKTLYNTRLNV